MRHYHPITSEHKTFLQRFYQKTLRLGRAQWYFLTFSYVGSCTGINMSSGSFTLSMLTKISKQLIYKLGTLTGHLVSSSSKLRLWYKPSLPPQRSLGGEKAYTTPSTYQSELQALLSDTKGFPYDVNCFLALWPCLLNPLIPKCDAHLLQFTILFRS